MNKHIHHDCIVAWAAGNIIEWYDIVADCWTIIHHPAWNERVQYRIQPSPKKKIVLEAWLSEFGYILYRGHPKTTIVRNLAQQGIRVPELDKEIEIK